MLYSGISYFTSNSKETGMACVACGEDLKGKQVDGPLNYAMALARKTKKHWVYSCPHAELDDHEHLVQLVKLMMDLVSDKLKDIVRGEFEEKRDRFILKHFKK